MSEIQEYLKKLEPSKQKIYDVQLSHLSARDVVREVKKSFFWAKQGDKKTSGMFKSCALHILMNNLEGVEKLFTRQDLAVIFGYSHPNSIDYAVRRHNYYMLEQERYSVNLFSILSNLIIKENRIIQKTKKQHDKIERLIQ